MICYRSAIAHLLAGGDDIGDLRRGGVFKINVEGQGACLGAQTNRSRVQIAERFLGHDIPDSAIDGILSDLELKAQFLFYHTAGFHPIVENTHFSMELHTVEDQLQVLCKWEALEAGVTCSLFCTLPDVQQAESGIPADMTASVQFPPLCVKELTNDTLTLLFSKAMEDVVAKDDDMSNGILLSYTSGSLQLEGIKLSPKEGSVSAEVYYDDKNCTVFPIAAADFDDYQIASMARYLAQAIMTPNAAQ